MENLSECIINDNELDNITGGGITYIYEHGYMNGMGYGYMIQKTETETGRLQAPPFFLAEKEFSRFKLNYCSGDVHFIRGASGEQEIAVPKK